MNGANAVVRQAAPAKINLFLHVFGRRADGMHRIDSLVVFAALGDVVAVRAGDGISLIRSGPMAGDLSPPGDDLVLRAAALLRARAGVSAGAAIELQKNLPVASGIGGGSADAAATLRALMRLWRIELPPARLASLALELGADMAVCLDSKPARVAGIGDRVTPLDGLPVLHAVLVNPRHPLATAAVFAGYAAAPPPVAEAGPVDAWSGDAVRFARQLAACRNDLTGAATALCPAVGDVLAAIGAQPDCLLARMSGSGATCFGLFAHGAGARAAAAALRGGHPDWWVAASLLAPPDA